MDKGLVFMSDTRTNASLDNIATFRKMFAFSREGDRQIVVMTSGNLATTQAVINLLEERSSAGLFSKESVFEAPTMFQVVSIIGRTLRDVISDQSGESGQNASTFHASFIVGGQINGGQMRLFLVYPEGNFIEASTDTPFFQIGETKYGQPILVRAFDRAMGFEEAIKLLMLSFDSTIKANLSVSSPFDVMIFERDRIDGGRGFRIETDDPYFQSISSGWSDALRDAFRSLDSFDLEGR